MGVAAQALHLTMRRSKFGEPLRAGLREGVYRIPWRAFVPHRPVPPRNRAFAKMMRREMTTPELRLWLRLKKPGLPGFRFRRQVPIGPYIVDFPLPGAAPRRRGRRRPARLRGGRATGHRSRRLASRERIPGPEVHKQRRDDRPCRRVRHDPRDGNDLTPSIPPPEIAVAISTSPQGGGSPARPLTPLSIPDGGAASAPNLPLEGRACPGPRSGVEGRRASRAALREGVRSRVVRGSVCGLAPRHEEVGK